MAWGVMPIGYKRGNRQNGEQNHQWVARGDEQPPWPQRRIGGRLVQPGAGFIIENPRGEWIAEDNSAVQRLMDRTIGSRSARGLTGLST